MPWNRLTTLLLTAAGTFHLHRAWSLAVTTDEAFTAISFASPSWLQILTTYDANHHILHSLLCKLSLTAFGWNQLALRLPSLLACLLWLFIAYRLARRLFPDSPFQFVLCAWLVFHPALYDWFSLARGYSLALAFLLAAVYELAGPLPTLTRASVWLGLSVASNFVFAIPAAAVAIGWTAARAFDDRRIWTRLSDLAVPGAALTLLITAIPLSRAEGSNFYYGAPNLFESLDSLFGIPHQDFLSYVLIASAPLTLAAAIWLSYRDETLRFFAFSLSLCLLAVAAMRIAGIPLPYGRTGAYITLLWILCVLSLAGQFEAAPSIWPSVSRNIREKVSIFNNLVSNAETNTILIARNWIWVLLLAVSVLFTFSVPAGYFSPWQYDAGNRAVMDHLLRSGTPSPTVAASPMLVPGLEFYRRRPASSAWPEILPFFPGAAPSSKSAFLILRTDETRVQPPSGYTPIWRDFTSGIILYRR